MLRIIGYSVINATVISITIINRFIASSSTHPILDELGNEINDEDNNFIYDG